LTGKLTIGRKAGSSEVASAAYRSASRMRDERLGRVQDFSKKRGVVHSEVLLPDGAPEVWSDRERLWNDVEAFEVKPLERLGKRQNPPRVRRDCRYRW
jgi:MobA/MobL family.